MHTAAFTREQRERVSRQREANFEAYHSWEYVRSLYNEITDIAERVRAPISPMQEFALTDDGLVSTRGDIMRPVIETGLAEAQRMALHNPDWRVEVTRRTIDLEEYDELEALARQGEGAGALVSYWLIPDAVREGDSTIPGYNRERLKMFTRVAVPTKEGIAIKYHSYDGSYVPGVQAMDEALGFVFDPDRGSEQIASERRRITVPVESLDELDELLRQAYDGTMSRDFGGEWFGGRPPLEVKDVIGFIADQTTLLNEHMSELSKIFALTRDTHERNRFMEPHRYNLAAAIDDLLHGKEVTSASEAGEGARSEGRNLDGDCPTGDSTTADQLDQLGFKVGQEARRTPDILAAGECVACLTWTAIVINKCNMCLGCENVHNRSGNVGLDQIIKGARDKRVDQERRKQARNAREAKLKKAGRKTVAASKLLFNAR